MQDKKRNILFISSWYPHAHKPLNGIFVKRHAEACVMKGDVTVIFICSGEVDLLEESVEDGIYTIRGYYKSSRLKAVKLLRCFLLWRKAFLRYKKKKGKPSVMHINVVYPVAVAGLLLHFIYHIPYIITEHWTGYFPEDGRYKGVLMKTVTRMAVARASAVVTVSEKLSKMMQSLRLKNKYFVIPNVVDTEQFTTESSIDKQNSGVQFIHISSLDDAQKNVSGIIRTFEKFHAAYPGSKLTIAGKGESFAKQPGVDMAGEKTGSALAKLLSSADALILFSNYENLPCVMLESFCCGVPVIATRVGDIPNYINETNGILIKPGNETQLLEAMQQMTEKKSMYNAEKIRRQMAGEVSKEAVAKKFMEVYNTIGA